MFRSSVFAAAALGLIACLTLPAQAAGCGRVAIADMNWSSATFIAHVDRFILEHGYGCDAQLVVGDTMPTGTSMIEKGEPDIAPELWTNGIRAALDRGIAEKRLRVVSASLVNGGEEGFWVPQYLVDATPELATIAGVKKHAALFKNPEDPATALFARFKGKLAPEAIDARIDALLAPGGRLNAAIESAVGDAVGKALREALPGLIDALAKSAR